MTIQTQALGGSTYSPFSSGASGTDYTSRYIPGNDYTSPLSGQLDATGTTVTSARPIMFTSLSITFSAQTANVQLQIATAASGSGGAQSNTMNASGTVTWNTADTTPLQMAAFGTDAAGTKPTYYYGFQKQDANTVTFRRAVPPSSSFNPANIYENGTALSTGTPNWNTTTIGGSITWYHVPNAVTFGAGQGAATGGHGQVDLSWTAPSDNGGYGIYGYRIIYKRTVDTVWNVYGSHVYGSPSDTTGTSETVGGLIPGTSYDFQIAALNTVCDVHNTGVAYPAETNRRGNFVSITSPTGTNSTTVTAVAGTDTTIANGIKAFTSSSTNVKANTKVYNGSSFVNGSEWVFTGTAWQRKLVAYGGIVSEYTSGNITYRLHTFTAPGNFVISNCDLKVDYLLVGGGGSGGGSVAGGGGGGGVLQGTTTLTPNTYAITTGSGGNQNGSETGGNPGTNSTAFGLTAVGGGGGASSVSALAGILADTGGSGGGGSLYSNSTGAGTGAAGTAGQGFAGGSATGTTYGGAGGGGAGGVGGNVTTTLVGGVGGIGVASSITGSTVYYGGGGGGGSSAAAGGAGGNGGGGAGGTAATRGTAGTMYLGGGGGGGWSYSGGCSGAGGHGIVIVRYPVRYTV